MAPIGPIGKEHWLTQLLEQQPDVTHTDLWTVIKPVHHFIRGMIVYDFPEKKGLLGTWDVRSLWVPGASTELEGSIDFGIPFYREGPVTVVDIIAPMPHDIFRERIEQITLPYLRSIDSMGTLYRESVRNRGNLMSDSPESLFHLELAMGNFDTARQLLERHRDDWFHKPVNYFEEEDAEHTRQLCRLLDHENYSGIALLFHEWEALNVERREIDHIWETTPFPFEPGYREWRQRPGNSG